MTGGAFSIAYRSATPYQLVGILVRGVAPPARYPVAVAGECLLLLLLKVARFAVAPPPTGLVVDSSELAAWVWWARVRRERRQTAARGTDGRGRERELASHVCGDWSTGKGAAAGDMSSFFPGERERQLPRSRKRELVMCTRSES